MPNRRLISFYRLLRGNNMKKLLKTLFLIALCVGISGVAFAESAGRAGAYLKMGVGARALGMGSAYVAAADDSSSAFWNPAGLALLERPEATFMHADLTMDRDYNFVNYAHPLSDSEGRERGVVALSHIRFGVDGIPETREASSHIDGVSDYDGKPATNVNEQYEPGQPVYIFSYFSDTEKATFGSYARKLGNGIYGGVNIKYLSHDLFRNSASGWGLDLGFLYEANENTMVGLSVRDIGSSLKWDTDSGHRDNLPTTTTLGVAYQARDNLLLAADVNKVSDMNPKLFAGAEYWMQEYVALRLGSNDGDLTLGASFKLDTWRFDYSYADEVLGDAHRISATKSF